MSQSLLVAYLHIVFSTKGRRPWFDLECDGVEMFAYLAGACRNLGWMPVVVNGFRDHVHLLLRMGKSMTVSKLIGELKKDSSKWFKTKGQRYAGFYWQSGYGCFSVSPSELARVQRYIENQKHHHRKMDFKSEYLKFLQQNGAPFDERYLWD